MVKEVIIEFKWHPGFAKSQAQKSIASLHKAAGRARIGTVLEISSKSPDSLGVSLSAFNLILAVKDHEMSVECAFQGSKVFRNGGPYTDLYSLSSKEAKTDQRLRSSGDLMAFNFLGERFPSSPATAFYDWLYITALCQNSDLAERLLAFQGFSDIAFNPKRSINCQAHSAALYVSLCQKGILESTMQDVDSFIRVLKGEGIRDSSVRGQTHQPKLL